MPVAPLHICKSCTLSSPNKLVQGRMLLMLVVMVYLSFGMISCNDSGPSRKASTQKKSGTSREATEVLYDDIHKLIYVNPSMARKEILLILDTLDESNRVSQITLLKHLGSSYVFETRYPEAISHYQKALAIAGEMELWFEIGNINNNLGVIYNEIGNYKTAYLYLTEALNYYEKAGNSEKRSAALNNIGLVYLNLKNFQKSRTYFNESLDSLHRPSDTILIVSVLNNIALSYLSEDNSPLAFSYLNRAVDLSQKVNNKYGLCISYQLMGNIYLKLDEPKRAYESYTRGINIAESANLTYQLAASRLGLAGVLLRMDKTAEASEIAYDVMAHAEEQNSLTLKSSAHEVLSDIYEKTGNHSKSLMHFKEHVAAQQEVVNQTIIHQVYDVELNHLDQLNKMQKLELEKKELAISKTNNLLFFLSLTFIMLLTGLYLLYLNHRDRQKVKLQQTVIELTGKKSMAALEAEVRERKRIGQELHDSLGHLLSLAGLYAGVLHKRKDIAEEKRRELLESLMKSIDDAFTEVHNISHNLAPSLLSEQGLKGALKSISDKVNQSTRLAMSFDTFGLNGKLDDLIENTLFHSIQEIVNNTIKHAEATKLFIQVTADNKEISLMAEDNGKGFNPAEINEYSSFGLSHMRSRIDNLNGTLFIDSSHGRGTIISILIPLSRNEV